MWGSIAAAGLSSIGSIFGGQRSNAASAREAQRNRDFQERMSNTAHQRESADLEAAGLNRILSVSGGGPGASTPAGSVAPQNDTISPAIASAVSVIRSLADTAKTNAETISEKLRPALLAQEATNKEQEQLKILQDTSTAKQLQHKLYEETLTEQSRRTHINAQALNTTVMTNLLEKQNVSESLRNQILSSDSQVARAAARRALTEEEIDKTLYGIVMRYIDRGMKSVSPFIRR